METRRRLWKGILGFFVGGTALNAASAINEPRHATLGATAVGGRGISVLDYIPASEHPAIAARASTRDVTSYLQAAVDSLPPLGGTVFFPAGKYSVSGLAMAEGVVLRGEGSQTSTLRHTGSAVCLQFGRKPSAVKRGMGVSDIGINLTAKTATAMNLNGIVGGNFKNIYIEGSGESGRSDKGIVIDGGNASSFFNTFENVEISHIEAGFQLIKTGKTNGTTQVFINCAVFGDRRSVGARSIGVQVNANQGNGSVWIGGNIEFCGKGFLFRKEANGMTVVGCRFEDNHTDIEKELTSYPCSFISCVNMEKYTNNGGSGYGSDTLIGCTNGLGFPVTNRLFAGVRAYAQTVNDSPVYGAGIAGQVAPLSLLENAVGQQQHKVAADGDTQLGADGIAPNATSGFAWIPGGSGAPTGVPKGGGNRIALYVDRTSHRLYFYSGGAWRSVGS